LYKVLLCWRYLLTRYLALACIVSVMLGVATLIVVNSVMSGFSTKLKDRLRGQIADVVVECVWSSGIDDVPEKLQRIHADPYLNEHVEAVSPLMEIFGIVEFFVNGEPIMRPVNVLGIDPKLRKDIGGFTPFLLDEENRKDPSFNLPKEAQRRFEENRWRQQEREEIEREEQRRREAAAGGHKTKPAADLPPVPGVPPLPDVPLDPNPRPDPEMPPAIVYVPPGMIVGHALVSSPDRTVPAGEKPKDIYYLHRGDDIHLYTVSGEGMRPVHARFVVTDYIKTGMSDYDSRNVYVPLEYLQKLRGMDGRVSSLQIKLKNSDDPEEAKEVVEHLKSVFSETTPDGKYPIYPVLTWQDKQGPLLAAISIERGLLNVLLFLIIAVAGFGILAIFSMIVVEKTRDIGILKALGASNWGVMKIFLGYGLLLGTVGATLGTVLGLTITYYLNEIEAFLTRMTGQEIFDRHVYYFDRIPTDIQASNVLWVNLGALGIAVLFSVLPALRAAMLHPVRALRYE
jgi:lipoprotein-releasing system permease protein